MGYHIVNGTVVTYIYTKNKEEDCSIQMDSLLYRLYHVDLLGYLDLQILPEKARTRYYPLHYYMGSDLAVLLLRERYHQECLEDCCWQQLHLDFRVF